MTTQVIRTKHTLKSGKGTLAVEYQQINPNAPTIIFLHDSLGCVALWRDFPAALAKVAKCNYLVYDRLGYGQSTKDENLLSRQNDYLEKEASILIELIKAFVIQQPILFGHSDGGSIGIIAAAKAPILIKGLISQAGHIFVEDITLVGIQTVHDSYLTTNLREKLMKYHGDKVDTVFYGWTNIWLSDHFRDWHILDLLPQIICPTLIIQGEKDEYGTLKQVDRIIDNIAGAGQQLILENTFHSPHKEQPKMVIEHTALFIEKLMPSL